MKDNHPHVGDKVPRPLSSEEAQQGEQVPDPIPQPPDPDTEVADKVTTPTSIQEQEAQIEAIERRLLDVAKKVCR